MDNGIIIPNDETKALLSAAIQARSELPPHPRPSPSGLSDCSRAIWAAAKGIPPDPAPQDWGIAESYIAARSGDLTQDLLAGLVEKARLGTLVATRLPIPGKRLATFHLAGGEADGVFRRPDGEECLLEIKRKDTFEFLKVAQEIFETTTVRESVPRDWLQVQAYLHLLDLRRCLYVVGNWGRGSLTYIVRSNKYFQATRPPGLIAAWIERSELSAQAIRDVAHLQAQYIQNASTMAQVPAEFDPATTRWPCAYCDYHASCLAVETKGGPHVQEEDVAGS